MFFFKHHVVRFQIVVLVVSLLLLAGCITTLPASPEADVPAPAETTAQAVTQSDVRPAQPAGVMPEQLQDLSSVAEYQSRLSGGDFGEVDARGLVAVEAAPDQIADRQALAEYQLHLSDGDLQPAASREFRGVQVMPDQIPDRQALADYQALVGSGDFNALAKYQRPLAGSDSSPLRGPKLADVVEMPDQIPDRQALADYQARLSDLWR